MSFIEDEALSRGAAIAFYAVTSLAPVLLSGLQLQAWSLDAMLRRTQSAGSLVL
jgi:membrane protein